MTSLGDLEILRAAGACYMTAVPCWRPLLVALFSGIYPEHVKIHVFSFLSSLLGEIGKKRKIIDIFSFLFFF